MNHKSPPFRQIAGLISVFLMLVYFSTVTFAQERNKNNDFEISKNLDIFSELYKQLDINYVDEISPGELVKTGIDAMLESLDPFTNYIPESQIEDYKMLTTGQYGGIGALIHKEDDYVIISEPYEGFPAHKAGLVPGDKILEVDGKSAKDKNTDEVSAILKGEPGTSLTLLIERAGTEKPFEVELKRENIKIDNIPYYGMLNEHIGYIKLSGFTQNAGKEVRNAFLELKEKNNMQGLVLDLRGNGGGLLNEAVNIVNIFTDKGELVVSTKGKDISRNISYYTTNQPDDTEIPLIVLVDPGSASASEIVSGALQDIDRAVILGQRTYGKGLVQNVLPLSYNSKVKVTVAKYYIPSGRCIQAIDYSHKDDEGVAHKVPDSLISEFNTKNGRIVFDGGGIEPDIALEPETMSPISMELLTDFIIFDYANKFAREHDSIAPPITFEIDDEIYNDFIIFVNGIQDFTYTTNSEKSLQKLKKVAEKEEYLDDINAEIEALEAKLMHNKEDDLQTQRDEISEMLKLEISSRFYFQKGRIISNLKSDPEVKKAIEIINDKKNYSGILDGTVTKASLD
ncbi:MAG: S41 family peptidase [Bacteroidales bacterium]|nr:S41 family peptidase [Bacteroidales bacterium]